MTHCDHGLAAIEAIIVTAKPTAMVSCCRLIGSKPLQLRSPAASGSRYESRKKNHPKPIGKFARSVISQGFFILGPMRQCLRRNGSKLLRGRFLPEKLQRSSPLALKVFQFERVPAGLFDLHDGRHRIPVRMLPSFDTAWKVYSPARGKFSRPCIRTPTPCGVPLPKTSLRPNW